MAAAMGYGLIAFVVSHLTMGVAVALTPGDISKDDQSSVFMYLTIMSFCIGLATFLITWS